MIVTGLNWMLILRGIQRHRLKMTLAAGIMAFSLVLFGWVAYRNSGIAPLWFNVISSLE